MSTLALSRRRFSIWGVLAVLAAIATGLAVYSYLSWLRSQIPVAGKLVPLLVAARDLEPGTVIEPGTVRLADHPEHYLPPAALSSIDQAEGQVLSVPVFEGEAITSSKIAGKGGLSSIVPPGSRAYSLSVSSGLGFAPKPGDRVDVIVTFPAEVLGEPTSMTVLRGKDVAGVATGSSESFGKVGETLGVEESRDKSLGITLFITPEEVQKLAMAEALGRITVVLAPAHEESQASPAPVRPRDLSSR
jgi:pilus assembly protein CpaB